MTRSDSGFGARVKRIVRAALVRAALLAAGCAALIGAIFMNLDAGRDVVAGLLWPDSPQAIVVSVSRLIAPVIGLWLIYRALR